MVASLHPYPQIPKRLQRVVGAFVGWRVMQIGIRKGNTVKELIPQAAALPRWAARASRFCPRARLQQNKHIFNFNQSVRHI